MKKNTNFFSLSVHLFCFSIALSTALFAKDTAVDPLKKVIHELHQSEEELKSHQQSLQNLTLSLEQSETEISVHYVQAHQLQSSLQQVQKQYADHVALQNILKKKIQNNETELLKLSQWFLRVKAKIPLSAILSLNHPGRAQEQLKILSHIRDQKTQKWRLLKQQQQDLQHASEQQVALQVQLNQLLQQHEKSIAILREEQIKRAQIIQTLRTAQIAEQQKIEQLKQDEKALRLLMAQQKKKNVKAGPLFVSGNHLPFPLQSKPKSHTPGLLFPTHEGAKIQAIAAGRVIFSSYFRHWGFLIILDHGNGWMSLYAHNQSLLKKQGEKVLQGDTIALAGNSGGATGAELYFEIRHRGIPQDPLKWCHAQPMNTPKG